MEFSCFSVVLALRSMPLLPPHDRYWCIARQRPLLPRWNFSVTVIFSAPRVFEGNASYHGQNSHSVAPDTSERNPGIPIFGGYKSWCWRLWDVKVGSWRMTCEFSGDRRKMELLDHLDVQREIWLHSLWWSLVIWDRLQIDESLLHTLVCGGLTWMLIPDCLPAGSWRVFSVSRWLVTLYSSILSLMNRCLWYE